MLGGTVFLGRHTVEAALARGHSVTLFNRGQHNADLFPEADKLRGNRDGGLDALRNRRWDAVIDFCGYLPRLVGDSAALLAGSVDRYIFISSVSVYAGPGTAAGLAEDAPVGRIDNPTTETITAESYGPLKALCEEAVDRALPGRAVILRPGLIVGPQDPTDRFTYWPVRAARGGEVLCPGYPDWETQIIDARDLADWTVALVEAGASGVYNAAGPEVPLRFGELLTHCRDAAGSDARWRWLDERWLLDKGVQPWSDLPLWLAGEDILVRNERARAAGLKFRPVADTVRDTLAWATARPEGLSLKTGLSPEREADLLSRYPV